MLYNPDWQTNKTKPDVSLASLISWLQKQPSDLEYNFYDKSSCALGQWLKSIDTTRRPNMGSFSYTVNGNEINLIAFLDIAFQHPRTFGAALERAKALV